MIVDLVCMCNECNVFSCLFYFETSDHLSARPTRAENTEFVTIVNCFLLICINVVTYLRQNSRIAT